MQDYFRYLYTRMIKLMKSFTGLHPWFAFVMYNDILRFTLLNKTKLSILHVMMQIFKKSPK